MTNRTRAQITLIFALTSLAFTLGVWTWMLTRPAGTFHDQGGMAITIVYFPTTFVVWLVCVLLSLVFRRRRIEGEVEAEVVRVRKLRRFTGGLIALGLLCSIGTLFIA